MKTKRAAGMSLVEVLIASVILVGVTLAAFATLHTATTYSAKGSAASEINTRGTRFLALCRDDMSVAQYGGTTNLGSGVLMNLGVNPFMADGKRPSSFLAPGSNFLSVGYQISGNRDTKGQKTAGGVVSYGYNAPFNIPKEDDDGLPPFFISTNHAKYYEDLVCYLRFEAETVFKESTSSPDAVQCADWDTNSPKIFPPFPALTNPSATSVPHQILMKDLNGDGDMTDTYVRGKIVKLVYAPYRTPASDLASTTQHPVALAHPAGVSLNGTALTPLLLSREVVSDLVMLRVNSSAAGDFYCDFDGHKPATLADIDAIFRFVGASGGVDEAMVNYPSGTDPTTMIPEPKDGTNAKGILISVIHGDFDGTPKGFVTRKNKQLIRTKSDQSNPGGSTP